MISAREHAPALNAGEILKAVDEELRSTPVIDVHTHLFMPSLGRLGLWGIDELLTYHYLEAELFRSSSIEPREYFGWSKRAQADAMWQALFVENTPVSESTRGVIAVLSALGLPVDDLDAAREYFAGRDLGEHISKVLELSGVSEVVMTNDPLDPEEAPLWEQGAERDPRFHPCCGWTGF